MASASFCSIQTFLPCLLWEWKWSSWTTSELAGQDRNSLVHVQAPTIPLPTAQLFQRDTPWALPTICHSGKTHFFIALLRKGSLKGLPPGVILHRDMQSSLRDTCTTDLFAKGKDSMGWETPWGVPEQDTLLQQDQAGVQNAYFKLTPTEK